MICPDCGQEMRSERTMRGCDLTMRWLVSECGARFESHERLGKRLNARLNQRLIAIPVQKPPENHTGTGQKSHENAAKTAGVDVLGGRGGCPDLDLFPSDLPPDPSQQSGSGARAIRRGRPDLAVYPTEFEVLWAVARKQGKCGNKLPAFKSFNAIGADDHLNALILTRYREWCQTDQWKRGFNPHLATWLNQRGWEEAPTASDLAGTTNARLGANGSATHDRRFGHARAEDSKHTTTGEVKL